MVQMLNVEQKEFFYHVLHHIKTSDEPIYSFLSGGGGVGKVTSQKHYIKQLLNTLILKQVLTLVKLICCCLHQQAKLHLISKETPYIVF